MAWVAKRHLLPLASTLRQYLALVGRAVSSRLVGLSAPPTAQRPPLRQPTACLGVSKASGKAQHLPPTGSEGITGAWTNPSCSGQCGHGQACTMGDGNCCSTPTVF